MKTNNKLLIFALVLFSSIQAFADSSVCALVSNLKEEQKKSGIQVGLIVDPHGKSGKSIYTEIVTIPSSEATLFDALKSSSLNKGELKWSQFSSTKVEIKAMLGINIWSKQKVPTVLVKINDNKYPWYEGETWGQYTATSNSKKWTASAKGIAETPVKDGMIAGFSYTDWNLDYELKVSPISIENCR